MNSNDLEPDALFTTNGVDVWRMVTYCNQPTCRLKNLETQEIEDFGMGGITACRFHRIAMPIQPDREAEKPE